MVIVNCKFLVIVLLATNVKSGLGKNQATSIIAGVLRESEESIDYVSPILIADFLWQAYLGAGGKTAEEIRNVLQLNNLTKKEALQQITDWKTKHKPPEGVTLSVGHRLYAAKYINILPEYLKQMKDLFHVESVSVEPEKSEQIRNEMFDWIYKIGNATVSKLQTRTKSNSDITDLIDEAEIETNVLFMSVMFLSGSWRTPFSNLVEGPFHKTNDRGETTTIQVAKRAQIGYFRYSFIKTLDADSLELPFAKSSISMIILIPRAIDGIDKLIRNLDKLNNNEIAPKSKEVKLAIFVPLFNLESLIEPSDDLQNLGVKQLFVDANLEAMTNWKAAKLATDYIHAVSVFINDGPNEPLGIHSQINQTDFPNPTSVPVVDANHPFLFLIKDDDNIYFAGRLSNIENFD